MAVNKQFTINMRLFFFAFLFLIASTFVKKKGDQKREEVRR